MKSVVQSVLNTSVEVINDRDQFSITRHLVGEVRELMTEVENQFMGQPAGEDGVLGEAADVIICAVDLIHNHCPGITEEEILAVVQQKLEKWKRLYGQPVEE